MRSDATQLVVLVALVDDGTLHIDNADRLPLADLPAVYARAALGTLAGKVVIQLP